MADGSKSSVADATAVEVTEPRLSQRLAAIRADASGIGKQDIKMKNKEGTKEWTIKSHTVEAVLSEIRPLLDRNGVGLLPMLKSYAMAGNLCTASFDFEFEDLATGETKVIPWAGSGTDNSDKALAKAGTNALKEMLKKVFLITDRDDAREEDDKVEHQTDEGLTRANLEREQAKARATFEQWGKTFKAAVDGATSAAEVDRLFRENNEQLQQCPAVTYEFFATLRKVRKAALGGSSQANGADSHPADGSIPV